MTVATARENLFQGKKAGVVARGTEVGSMAMRLGEQELRDVAAGAAFLGAGGGGALKDGLRLLNELVRAGKAQVEVIDPTDMGSGDWAVMVAGIGAPRAMEERGFGPEAVVAFETMRKVAYFGGKKIKYLMAGELGGFNTMVPVYVAAQLGVPMLDADGNGRAVPELATGLYPIYDIPPVPLVMAGKNGDSMVIFLNDPRDHHAAENIARHVCLAYGMAAAFCTWIVDRDMILRCLAPRTLTQCRNIGAALRRAEAEKEDVGAYLQAAAGTRELFRGRIEKIELRTEGGFDFGTTVLAGIGAYQGRRLFIDFKNENILARTEEGKVLLTVPDLICLVDLAAKAPLTNAETAEGQELGVFAVAAPENWRKHPGGFGCWKHILEKMGYTGGQVSVEQLA